MFQFTTTNVINSSKDFSTGKDLYTGYAKTDDKPGIFDVKRVNAFRADCIKHVYKAEPVEADNAKVILDMAGLGDVKDKVPEIDGKVFNIRIVLGLTQGDANSKFANDHMYKSKPITIDFAFDKDDTEKSVKKFLKVVSALMLNIYGDKILEFSAEGTLVTIQALSEYVRFRDIVLSGFDPAANHGMGEYVKLQSIEDLNDVTKDNSKATSEDAKADLDFFPGKEGFGTYNFLLHNLRLPTMARTHAFALNQEESPVIGAKYTQFTIHYCVNRGILGDNAVGDLVKSLTTHVFYVKEDLVKDFEEALNTAIADADVEIETVPEA